MEQFNPSTIPDVATDSQANAFTSEPVSSLSWIDEQINQSIAPVVKPVLEETKTVDTHQSIIDEFDPMVASQSELGSVSTKVNHFNKVNLSHLTPKPFVSNNQNNNNVVKPNYNYSMPVQSSFNPAPVSHSKENEII